MPSKACLSPSCQFSHFPNNLHSVISCVGLFDFQLSGALTTFHFPRLHVGQLINHKEIHKYTEEVLRGRIKSFVIS